MSSRYGRLDLYQNNIKMLKIIYIIFLIAIVVTLNCRSGSLPSWNLTIHREATSWHSTGLARHDQRKLRQCYPDRSVGATFYKVWREATSHVYSIYLAEFRYYYLVNLKWTGNNL
jgi:hypothetical protein